MSIDLRHLKGLQRSITQHLLSSKNNSPTFKEVQSNWKE